MNAMTSAMPGRLREPEGPQARPIEDWENLHPQYGPCDAFGPEGRCSACIGIAERNDGAWIEIGTGRILKRPPLMTRLKVGLVAFWAAFNA